MSVCCFISVVRSSCKGILFEFHQEKPEMCLKLPLLHGIKTVAFDSGIYNLFDFFQIFHSLIEILILPTDHSCLVL